ncbi:unnamed protein product (macronuclear) [Paramecium tetraurelia]|uniref:Uncharacterized protein n=1 Tax=Paramecium tetraurelia TaxID=5888 RepID=A0DLI5_PARTE|nr:uncharacterized protein GSPATT00018219001 [Paramecium tetraurelia]CAK83902.1 unnamed protein product [Paramecium tetraurelia]|eukprot:XP_001451299.1 hypothetical protein (macronuclear) [Paramecium tetraurelia strain d4-2]
MQEQNSLFFCPENEDSEIIKAKTYDAQTQRIAASFYSQFSDGSDPFMDLRRHHQCNSAYSSSSLQSSRTLPDECMQHNYSKCLDLDILSEAAKQSFSFVFKSQEDWLEHFTSKCIDLDTFFKDCAFNSLIEKEIQNEDCNIKKGIVLTVDYFTNLFTFSMYLIWKWIQNENQMDMANYVSCQNSIPVFFNLIFQFRFNELKNDKIFIAFVEQTIQTISKSKFEDDQQSKPYLGLGISQHSKPLPLLKENEVFPWNPEEVAKILSTINQAFYADLQIRNVVVKGGLKYYFKRINTLSQYIIYSVVKSACKYKRQEALSYWIDLAERLQIQNDLEGLFIVFKYGIQLLLKDYISTMPILFKHQNRISKINAYYEQQIKDNLKNMKPNPKGYNIPSFQKYQTHIKRLELQAKQNRQAFEQIASLLAELVAISKEQQQRQQIMNHQLSFHEQQIVRFLTQGIENELENSLKIPLEKETLVYIQLIKLSKIMN